MSFQREHRYIVLKISDIEKSLSHEDRSRLVEILNTIERKRQAANIPIREYVVTESTWSCYKEVWKLIQKEWEQQNELEQGKA